MIQRFNLLVSHVIPKVSEPGEDKVLNGFRVIIVTYLPIVSEPGV